MLIRMKLAFLFGSLLLSTCHAAEQKVANYIQVPQPTDTAGDPALGRQLVQQPFITSGQVSMLSKVAI